ncbi:MAG: FecR domain-containing protein [Prolixibacteraceae bacterium]|nr:FecR domain-containing protein [Prolixibacteraceae bacterium]
MKNNDKNKKAEDILTDDSLVDQMVKGTLPDEEISAEEIGMAQDISRAAKPVHTSLTAEEKDFLGERINQRILGEKRKRNLIWIGSAAAILFLVGLTFVFQLADQSEIRNYALGITVKPDSDFTRLLLSGEKEIRIDSPQSRIEYSENGQEVKIDTQPQIEQQSTSNDHSFNTVIVPYGKRSQITLSDNSKVYLNSGSKLIYPAKFDPDKREVYLEGEAIFEVAHDASHPFYVITHDLEVKVLGTIFNLSAYHDDKTVNTVLENGSVELRFESNSWLGFSKVKMVPGMLAVFDPAAKNIDQTKVNTENYTSWKDGYLVLEKSTLESIAKKLSRYYNVSIGFDNPELALETFSGDLDLGNSAIQVLELIAQTMDIEINQVGSEIRIKNKPD